jgi:hypothetical protein
MAMALAPSRLMRELRQALRLPRYYMKVKTL